ncbi:MAG TPA: LuxR C-terminal-related transcriptional regulator [Ktedonobacterales bacterium]|nr:LuxR C-terminal-related transcriptional regulator [Ktedonobacterales bacterium]
MAETIPILATKLYIPPPRPNRVLRPRLSARLNAGLDCKLTLISAPAGFGKTTLVSDWLAGCARPSAWLSLDNGDNDLARFLTYVVRALQTIAANMGEGLLDVLQSPQPPPSDALLTTLVNDIAGIAAPFVLVLDDYHVIDSAAIDHALSFLLDHLPPGMRVVITTREDPQLPLARLRARGHLTELRAADLRFTPSEAAAFLNHVMGLNLSPHDITTLETRTEGWIAGLQLAALSLQGHEDAAGFIQAFAGDHRYIADYLVDEVLERQLEPVRRFLLQTSVLDRISGPLCDAVTGRQESHKRLEALERGNFFVVPLDDQRRWYRYHHLFADVLHARLLAEQPDHVSTLHRRASAWYEQQGAVAEAIRHALAAGEAEDFAHAANLVELAVPALRQSRQEAALLGWLRALPDPLLRHRPVLSAFYAHALLASGELEGVEDRLRDAERWLDSLTDTADATAGGRARRDSASTELAEMVVVDQGAFERLPGTIAVARAGQALALGDVATSVIEARRALDLVSLDDQVGYGGAVALLGLASWASGDLETAYETFAEGIARVQRAGYLPDAVNGFIALADIRIGQGRLHEAMHLYEQGLQLARRQGGPVQRGAADLYVGMSAILREQNELAAATQQLVTSQELGEPTGMPQYPSRWHVAMARVREAHGDLDGALAQLQEAERRYVSDFFPTVRPIAACRARLWIKQGRVGEALGWVREQALSADDESSYLREFEHVTLARVLLAQYKSVRADERSLQDVLGLLERLLEAAEADGRTGSVLDILLVQAFAHQARGELLAALVPLRQALTLAEPEGYVRLFVDEGPPMVALLEAAAKHGIAQHYVRHLLTAVGLAEDKTPANQDTHGLIEPLSERELDVLRLLGTDLDGPEIARELVVSLNTLRTHTKNIYGKLGVNNRRAAVRRAEELKLLSQARRH